MHVLIVGAGLLGLTTAYFLRQAGAAVTVVERQAGVGLETSFANGAMLHASQANPWNEPGVLRHALRMMGREDSALLVRPRAVPGLWRWGPAFVRHSQPARYLRNFEKNAHLARYSLAEMRQLRMALNADYDQQQCGTMKLFRTAEEAAAAARLCVHLDTWGIEYEVIDATRAVALEPALAAVGPRLAGGLYFPGDESGDAFKFCAALGAALGRAGVTFLFGTTATRIRRATDGKITLVTSGDEQRADALVLAAGSHSVALARTVGLAVPVAPVKGYSITLACDDWTGAPRMPVIDDHLHAAVCPLGARIRVAGTAEFAGYDLALTRSRIANLFELVLELYPDFAPYLRRDTATEWAGLRPMSCDGVGIMGRTAAPGVYLNTGHGPLGWTMAAAAGRLVADEITGRPPALEMAAYRLDRFAGGWAS